MHLTAINCLSGCIMYLPVTNFCNFCLSLTCFSLTFCINCVTISTNSIIALNLSSEVESGKFSTTLQMKSNCFSRNFFNSEIFGSVACPNKSTSPLNSFLNPLVTSLPSILNPSYQQSYQLFFLFFQEELFWVMPSSCPLIFFHQTLQSLL